MIQSTALYPASSKMNIQKSGLRPVPFCNECWALVLSPFSLNGCFVSNRVSVRPAAVSSNTYWSLRKTFGDEKVCSLSEDALQMQMHTNLFDQDTKCLDRK